MGNVNAEIQKALIVVGSLLHDVGKFAQRAGGKRAKHAQKTEDFIKDVLPLPAILEEHRDVFAALAGGHHDKHVTDVAQRYIQRADRLSAGMDRERGKSGGNYLSARQESAFNSINVDDEAEELPHIFYQVQLDETQKVSKTQTLRYPLYKLHSDDSLENPPFPVHEERARATSYAQHYNDFFEALKSLKCVADGVENKVGEQKPLFCRHYVNSLQNVLEQYTWCVPSSTNRTKADISLYDHALTTAAIAQALSISEAEHDLAGGQVPMEPLLLFGAEFSGIQNIIFGNDEIADKGVAKLLRARSFMVQALGRSIWLSILKEFKLYSVAKVMDAGGRFALLLPNTPTTEGKLAALCLDIEHFLLKRFGGRLRMAFAKIPLSEKNLHLYPGGKEQKVDSFRECFERFNDELDRQKRQPFAALLQKGASLLREPSGKEKTNAFPLLDADYEQYHENGACGYCGYHPGDALGAKFVEDRDIGADGANKSCCQHCAGLIKVGQQLPKAKYLIISEHNSGSNAGIELYGGLRGTLLTKNPEPADVSNALDIANFSTRDQYASMPIAGYIPCIDEKLQNFLADKAKLTESDGKLCFDGSELKLGNPKTFCMLAEQSSTRDGLNGLWRGIPALAAMKADVDNLGLVLGIGFGRDEKSTFSISRLAMVSRMLNHFFSAYLPLLVEKKFPDIYLVFAGGDDVFIIGPWPQVTAFAKRLRSDFRQFVGSHSDLSFSAGITLFKPRLPVRIVHSMAEEALKKAKEGDKNAIHLFDVTNFWVEYNEQMEFADLLERRLLADDEFRLSRGFVHRLLGYADDLRAFEKGEMKKGIYLSHLKYDLARNVSAEMPEYDKLLTHIHCTKLLKARQGISLAMYRTRTL